MSIVDLTKRTYKHAHYFFFFFKKRANKITNKNRHEKKTASSNQIHCSLKYFSVLFLKINKIDLVLTLETINSNRKIELFFHCKIEKEKHLENSNKKAVLIIQTVIHAYR